MRTRPHPELPDNLTGYRIVWVRPSTEDVYAGTVIADFRGQDTEDRLTRERIESNLLLAEDDDGFRHSVPSLWIEKWND